MYPHAHLTRDMCIPGNMAVAGPYTAGGGGGGAAGAVAPPKEN